MAKRSLSKHNPKIKKKRPEGEEKLRKAGSVKNWIATELDSGQLGIECPRCGGKAKINKRRWIIAQPDYLSRGCTYCFYVSWIPQNLLPDGDARLDSPQTVKIKKNRNRRRRVAR